jgi:arsenate reductase (glutaredoxin)
MAPKDSDWTVYHNPRCSKSRCALELLRDRGISPTVVEYLKDPPSEATLRDLLGRLGLRARDIVRTKEEKFASLRIDLEDESAVIQAIAKHPELLERPIVVRGKRAVLGRPPENLLDLI